VYLIRSVISGSIVFFSIFAWFTHSLHAQYRKVTLEKCVQIALQNHPEIKVSLEDQKKSVAGYKVATAQNKILVSGEVKTVEYLKSDRDPNKLNIPGRDTNFGLFAGATATYNLIDPKKSNLEEMSRLSVDMSKMKALKVRETVIFNVKSAYYNYCFAQENELLRKELKEKFRLKLDKAKKLFKNGLRPILDVSKAEVDLADAMLEHEKAKNNEKLMKAKLLASMGIIDESIEVSPEVVEILPHLKYSLDELYTLAEYNYPDIRIAQLGKQISKINIEVEQSLRYPKVDILASLGFENKFENREFKSWDRFTDKFLEADNWEPTVHAGFMLRIPIFDRGGIEGRVESAVADYRKSEYRERQILIGMRGLIRAYLQAINELVRQMEISILIIANAERHLMLAQKSYENGVSTQLDMQDAEMSVLKARLELIRSRYEYLKILARIANTVGMREEELCRK